MNLPSIRRFRYATILEPALSSSAPVFATFAGLSWHFPSALFILDVRCREYHDYSYAPQEKFVLP